MERGTHVHNSLEKVAKLWLLSRPGPTPEERHKAWADAFEQVRGAPLEGIMETEELASYLDRAEVIMDGLIPINDCVEVWFNGIGQMFELPSLPICGKIDLVSEVGLATTQQSTKYGITPGPAVIDYKTIGGEHRIKGPIDAKRSMQLKIYCLATGAERAGFIYLLPTSRARATFVEFNIKELTIAHNWLSMQLANILSCWRRFTGNDSITWGDTLESPDGDWDAWTLSSPDNFLCSPKWCDHYKQCIGKKA
jgi:hypothetical protein